MVDNEKPKIIHYDGSSESIKQIAKDIRNISCGTSLQSKFVLNQDKTISFYYQYLHNYPEWSDRFIRSFTIKVGQYIVQKEIYLPNIFNTMDDVNEFIKPKEQNVITDDGITWRG